MRFDFTLYKFVCNQVCRVCTFIFLFFLSRDLNLACMYGPTAIQNDEIPTQTCSKLAVGVSWAGLSEASEVQSTFGPVDKL